MSSSEVSPRRRESKGTFIPEIPCENLVRQICGAQWRNLPEQERDAAWGVAIVKSVLDGVDPDLHELSSHLGVEKDLLIPAFRRLSLNGVFLTDRIRRDTPLRRGDQLAWCYYAGYACGAVGTVIA